MSDVDWTSNTRYDRIEFEQVDPNDLDFVREELTGVDLRQSSLSFGYYTDTRVSGSLFFVNSNYIEGSLIRIHHYVDVWDYHQELGTFFVGNNSFDYAQGINTNSVDLLSALYGMQVEDWAWHYVISSGRYTKSVIQDMLDICGRPGIISESVSNVKFASAIIYEFGENSLASLYDVCSKSNARVDVDGHGRVIINPYVEPKALTPQWTWDFNSINSTITSPITVSNNRLDLPGRVSVIYKNGDTEIASVADASTASFGHPGRRGYRKTDTYSLSEMYPVTKSRADELAADLLKESSSPIIEYEFSSLYCPCKIGDGCLLSFADETKTCFVKNIEVSFKPGLEIKVLLKEV